MSTATANNAPRTATSSVPAAANPLANFSITIQKETQINAPAKIVFESILAQLGGELVKPDGSKMDMKIEPWPGGRWFRDTGNNTGHLWGHVQVIKPPTLLEFTGPLFMSYAAVNHVQYRVTEASNGKSSTLTLIHRSFGDISPEHREGMTKGWDGLNAQIKSRAER